MKTMRTASLPLLAFSTLVIGAVSYGLYVILYKRKTQALSPNSRGLRKSDAEKDKKTDDTTAAHLSSTLHQPTEADVKSVSCASDATLTDAQVRVLMSAIRGRDDQMKKLALQTITNRAAFTVNHSVLHDSGCVRQLVALLRSYDIVLKTSPTTDLAHDASAKEVSSSAAGAGFDMGLAEWSIRAVNNLAMTDNPQYLSAFQGCIDCLLHMSVTPRCSFMVRITALEALTNLSVTPVYHAHYLESTNNMASIIDTAFHSSFKQPNPNDDTASLKTLKLQSTRLLVNLTCNPDVMSNLLDLPEMEMLAKKILECDQNHGNSLEDHCQGNIILDDGLLLRYLNMLRNIASHPHGRKWLSKKSEFICDAGRSDGEKENRIAAIVNSCKGLASHNDSDISSVAQSIVTLLNS